jgi:RNA polymerase sigma-70 factor (ECF subfamily)
VTGRSPTAEPDGEVSAQGDEPTDPDLLRRHLQGDPDAFSALFRRHKQELWAVAIRLLGDVGRAAEAIQDAMVLAFWKGPEFGTGGAVTTWLCRIVVNVCLERMRRAPAAAGDGDLMAALRQLAVEQQSALVLVDMLGFSVADASEILGISADTLLSRRARGRTELVTELTHAHESPLRSRAQ